MSAVGQSRDHPSRKRFLTITCSKCSAIKKWKIAVAIESDAAVPWLGGGFCLAVGVGLRCLCRCQSMMSGCRSSDRGLNYRSWQQKCHSRQYSPPTGALNKSRSSSLAAVPRYVLSRGRSCRPVGASTAARRSRAESSLAGNSARASCQVRPRVSSPHHAGGKASSNWRYASTSISGE